MAALVAQIVRFFVISITFRCETEPNLKGNRKFLRTQYESWTSPGIESIPSDQVWPVGRSAFPDFFKPSTGEWWLDEIESLHKTIPFDGLWIVSIGRRRH